MTFRTSNKFIDLLNFLPLFLFCMRLRCSWVFGEFLCKMYQFIHSLSYTASIFILMIICMERYFAIIYPITCKQILTPTRLRVSIFSSLLFYFLILFWPLSLPTILHCVSTNTIFGICVPNMPIQIVAFKLNLNQKLEKRRTLHFDEMHI